MPAAGLVEKIARRWGSSRLCWLLSSLFLDVTLFALYGIYYGAVEGTSKAFIADVVSPDKRGMAYGITSAAVGVAALPASLIAGLLWQGIGAWLGFGPRAPFLFGAAMAWLAAALMVVWVPRSGAGKQGAF